MKKLFQLSLLVFLLPLPTLGATISDFNPFAHYDLEEVSGIRYDETANGLDLTDNNTVLYASGVSVGNSASFVKVNNEWLSHADDTKFDLSSSQDKSFSFWFKIDNYTDYPVPFAKWETSKQGYICRLGGGNGYLQCYLGNGTTGYGNPGCIGTVDLADDSWHHVLLSFDSSTDVLTAYLNGSTTPHCTSGAYSSSANSTADFTLSYVDIGWGIEWDGEIDSFTVFSETALDGDDAVTLYNSGVPLLYESTGTTTVTSCIYANMCYMNNLESLTCSTVGATTTCTYGTATDTVPVIIFAPSSLIFFAVILFILTTMILGFFVNIYKSKHV